MRFGIIAAMEEEKRLLEEEMTIEKRTIVANWEFIEGTFVGKTIVLVQSGIGKVMSALAAGILIDRFGVDLVINTGSAGGFGTSLEIGDIVIGTELAYCDADVTAFNYKYGQMPGMPERFSMQSEFLPILQNAIEKVHLKSHTGLIVSSDSFIHTDEQRKHILQYFPDVMASEMEGAAIAQACFAFKVPFIVIRAISDIPERGTSAIDFDTFIVQAGKRSAQMLHQLLQEWEVSEC